MRWERIRLQAQACQSSPTCAESKTMGIIAWLMLHSAERTPTVQEVGALLRPAATRGHAAQLLLWQLHKPEACRCDCSQPCPPWLLHRLPLRLVCTGRDSFHLRSALRAQARASLLVSARLAPSMWPSSRMMRSQCTCMCRQGHNTSAGLRLQSLHVFLTGYMCKLGADEAALQLR